MGPENDKSYSIIKGADRTREAPIVDVSRLHGRVQEARLLAALLESGWGLKTSNQQAESFRDINSYFSVSTSIYSGEKTHNIPITIDHAKPLTRFGHVERPLIFPTWLASVGDEFQDKRDYLISFQGLPTTKRVIFALDFLEVNFGQISPARRKLVLFLSRFPESGFRTTLLNCLFARFFQEPKFRFTWSSRGRNLTKKILDEEYWKILHRSVAVYCPEGDFGWTYRFYEAVLAGALPVIDQDRSSAFARPFETLASMRNIPDPGAIRKISKKNRLTVHALVTAKSELKPAQFGIN